MNTKGTLLTALLFLGIAMATLSQQTINQQLLIIKSLNGTGKNTEARQFVEDNVQLWNPELYIEFGNTLYELKAYKEALNNYLLAYPVQKEQSTLQIAKCYAWINKPELACEYLKQHLQQKERQMQFEIKSDGAFRAIETSDEWKLLWKTDWYSKYDLMLEDAWYEFLNQRYQQSMDILEKLTEIRKSMIEAYYLKALVYESLAEYENALICIDKVIAKKPEVAQNYWVKSRIERKNLHAKKAIRSISTALKYDSTRVDYFLERAKINLLLANTDAAVGDIEWLMKWIPNEETYFCASDVYTQAKAYHLAIKALNNCIKSNKFKPDYYIRRGDLYQLTQMFEFAEKDYTMALDFVPTNGLLFFKRGQARLGLKKRVEACSDFHKAYELKYTGADASIRQYCQQQLK